MKLPKIVVLLGPTASGKTAWGLKLAQSYFGEIISVDSRQIYRKMDIGTAKALGEWVGKGADRAYVIEGIRHHLVDFLDPGKTFTAAEFRDEAVGRIPEIISRGHVPFLVGGTGLYIDAVVQNWCIPRIPPNKTLRRSLEAKTEIELTKLLRSIDPEAVKKIDQKNKRRLVRALEVCILSGEPFSLQQKKGDPIVNALQIGIETPREILYDRIEKRIDAMVLGGLVDEIRGLRAQKYDWTLPSMSGIGYRQFRAYLEDDGSIEEAVQLLKRDTRHFARRQMTWFRRNKSIHWCRTYKEAEELVKEFLVS